MKSLQIKTRQMITRRVMLCCHNLRKALCKKSKKMGLMKKSKIRKTRLKYQIQTNKLKRQKKKFLSQTQNLMCYRYTISLYINKIDGVWLAIVCHILGIVIICPSHHIHLAISVLYHISKYMSIYILTKLTLHWFKVPVTFTIR